MLWNPEYEWFTKEPYSLFRYVLVYFKIVFSKYIYCDSDSDSSLIRYLFRDFGVPNDMLYTVLSAITSFDGSFIVPIPKS